MLWVELLRQRAPGTLNGAFARPLAILNLVLFEILSAFSLRFPMFDCFIEIRPLVTLHDISFTCGCFLL